MNQSAAVADQGDTLLELYDQALPQVYGYLLRRCQSVAVAEDLTAETFLAAVSAVQRGKVEQLTVAWLITVARNKLVDHWRRQSREERTLQLASSDAAAVDDGGWDEGLDEPRAMTVLAELGPHHRIALTLKYLDGLTVSRMAEQLGRTEHATEALLVRARAAFRKSYGERSDDAS